MSKTINGRPSERGAMYFEEQNGGYKIRKYCLTYCECGRKIGMTPEELQQFAENATSGFSGFIARIARIKILIP